MQPFLQERTVQRTCPRGVPAAAFCFTGSDGSNPRTTEGYAGILDFSSPIANACAPTSGTPRTAGFPDHNVVSIGAPGRDVFVTTSGSDCTSTGTAADPIQSFSAYVGTLTLH